MKQAIQIGDWLGAVDVWKRATWGGRKSLTVVSIFLCLTVFVPTTAQAATFPWRAATFSYNAKSTALARVLEEIFVTQYRPVEISDGVKALPSVSGDFARTPQAVFENLSQAYGLVSYFDGTTMFVTTLAENRTVLQVLTRVSASEVERAAQEFGYVDSRFVFRRVNSPPALQLSGPPAYVERISDVISVLEAGAVERLQDTRMAFRVIPLKHATAEDVTYNVAGRDILIRGVARSLRELVGGMGGLDGIELQKSGLEPPSKPTSTTRRPSSLLDSILPGDADLDQTEQKKPIAGRTKISGQHESRTGRSPAVSARIVGDSRMNAVVMMAPVEMLAMLEEVVRELDVEPELIQIEATVMDVQGDVLKELGFDWSLTGSRFQIASTTSGRGIGQTLDGDRVRGSGGNFSIFGGSAASNFLSRITALQTTGKTNIVSRPKLATLNGIEAILGNQQVFYPNVRGERTAQLYQVDVGLMMRVVPVVVRRAGGKADIRLRVFIEDGSIDNIGGGDTVTQTSKSSISTQAIMQDGESLLIGGYVKDSDGNSEAKVPLLGDIPGVGALFRYRKNNANRQERLFLITPKLLRGAEIEAGAASASDELGVASTVSLDSVPAMNRGGVAPKSALPSAVTPQPSSVVTPKVDPVAVPKPRAQSTVTVISLDPVPAENTSNPTAESNLLREVTPSRRRTSTAKENR